MAEEERENVATRELKACAEWLAYCLSIGWKKEQLDRLEEIWWRFHCEEKVN